MTLDITLDGGPHAIFKHFDGVKAPGITPAGVFIVEGLDGTIRAMFPVGRVVGIEFSDNTIQLTPGVILK